MECVNFKFLINYPQCYTFHLYYNDNRVLIFEKLRIAVL